MWAMKSRTKLNNCLSTAFLLTYVLALSTSSRPVMAQTKSAPAPSQNAVPAPPQPLPFAEQLRKTVVLIRSFCEVDSKPTDPPTTPEKNVLTASGTGFLVSVPDNRLAPSQAFQYLVTNRHVAEPGIEDGQPCKLLGTVVLVNPRDKSSPASTFRVDPNTWIFPTDDGVDLAAMPFGMTAKDLDFQVIPFSMFENANSAPPDNLIEGDPVIFAGLFVQFAGVQRFEPIVREGKIAMIPDEKISGTLKKPAFAYLTEAHSYGGNSGSPMFVNFGGFRNGSMFVGDRYKFLGVVAGGYHEGADFTLNVATTYRGQAEANSGISVIVPADEVKSLLMGEQAERQKIADIQKLKSNGSTP
jgi:trypsin-like peptidase